MATDSDPFGHEVNDWLVVESIRYGDVYHGMADLMPDGSLARDQAVQALLTSALLTGYKAGIEATNNNKEVAG